MATETLQETRPNQDPVDVGSISKTVMHGIFMTGLAPKSYGVSINPNCASLQRIQYMGEANVLMMPMTEVFKYLVTRLELLSRIRRACRSFWRT